MARTLHKDISELETVYLTAIASGNFRALERCIHAEAVFIDEFGQHYGKNEAMLIEKTAAIDSIGGTERISSTFGNIAVVTSVERWTGKVAQIEFDRVLHYHRIWKNAGKGWQLIFSSRKAYD